MSSQALVGWVCESPGRGTLSLIVSCLTTVFLCTWVTIHARVYKRSPLFRLHKLTLFLKTIIAPEFIAVEGLQEWTQARRMVKNCAGSTRRRLKLVHAFYIGMLALRYRTLRGKKVVWPNQFTWLLQQGLIDWEDHALWGLSEESIRDKSDADGAVKLLALGQVSWFVAQCIMRGAHNLPLSQLETMTLSYIPLVAVTYFFWWIKPKDVMTPSFMDLPEMPLGQKATFESMSVSDAFDSEGLGKQDSLSTIWLLTPRVFEKEAEDKALQEAEKKTTREAQRRLESQETKQAITRDDEGRENLEGKRTMGAQKASAKDTVVAYWDPELYHNRILWLVICVFGASFGVLHLISWNTVFPTVVEQWLWRAAALLSIVSMLIFMQFEKVVVRWGGPLTITSLVSPVLYLLSRLIMIALVIASFRAEDPKIYDTYVASTYWVHIF